MFNEKYMYMECIAIDYHSHPTFVHIIVVLNCVAVIVDKDNSPRWNPPTLTEVTPEVVQRYFARLPEERELKL